MEISEFKWSQLASLNLGIVEVHGLEVMDRGARINDSSFDFQIYAKASMTTCRTMGRRRSRDHAPVSVLCFQFQFGIRLGTIGVLSIGVLSVSRVEPLDEHNCK